MKRNDHGTSSKSQAQTNSWWHTTLLVWLFWLLSSQRATRTTSQSFSNCLLLLTFSNLLSEANSQVLQEPFPAVLRLPSLDGSNGFRIQGINSGDGSGSSVSRAGDINRDGIDDVIIGSGGLAAFIVFGSRSRFNALMKLEDLDGSNGFKLEYGDGSSSVACAGDFNSDGVRDVIIGVDEIIISSQNRSNIVFGSQSIFNASMRLEELNGYNRFEFKGGDLASAARAGDVNGDGIDDVILGAYGASPNGNSGAGESYIVFGSKSNFNPTFSLTALNGSNGFSLQGVNAGDNIGYSVSGAGDINGDGFDDVIISSINNQRLIYVVFGSNSKFNATMSLASLNGNNGFKLVPTQAKNYGIVDAAGDINGDGIDDVIIGCSGSDLNFNAKPNAGETFVVFGRKSGFNATMLLSSLNGKNGFRIEGANPADESGSSVGGVGDINGDGIDDIIIGAQYASPNGEKGAGESYVVFGNTFGFNATISLNSLNGENGFKIEGFHSDDASGRSVAEAGDINGDGINDVIVSAQFASPNEKYHAGESYVIFGHNIKRKIELNKNQFIIEQPGITKTLSSSEMAISYQPGSLDLLSRLNITISDVTHGEFKINAVSQQSPFTFKHALLSNQSVSFTHDGSDELPSYKVMVTDGRVKVGPLSVIAFVQLKNQLLLTQDELLILNSSMLNAKMTSRSMEELTYVISKPNQLTFNNFLNTLVTRFTQADVNAGTIRLISSSPSIVNAEYRPSFEFQIEVNNTDILPQPINGNMTYYLQPVITANALNVLMQGEQIGIGPQQLAVSYGQDTGDDLTITIDKVMGGTFSLNAVKQNSPFQFKARVIRQNALSFTQDGSNTLPSYEVSVSDGRRTAGPKPASVSAPFLETGSSNGVAIGIGTAIGILSCAGLFAGGYAFYRKRQADLSRAGNELDVTVSRIVYERLNINGVSNFNSGPGLKYVAQITEINQVYQRVNGEIRDVSNYGEALARAIAAVFSADADVIRKGNSLSFNIADENKRQPLRRQREAIVERCRNSVSEGNRELTTNKNGKDI